MRAELRIEACRCTLNTNLWNGSGGILEISGQVRSGDDSGDGGEEDAEDLDEGGLLLGVGVHGPHPVARQQVLVRGVDAPPGVAVRVALLCQFTDRWISYTVIRAHLDYVTQPCDIGHTHDNLITF